MRQPASRTGPFCVRATPRTARRRRIGALARLPAPPTSQLVRPTELFSRPTELSARPPGLFSPPAELFARASELFARRAEHPNPARRVICSTCRAFFPGRRAICSMLRAFCSTRRVPEPGAPGPLLEPPGYFLHAPSHLLDWLARLFARCRCNPSMPAGEVPVMSVEHRVVLAASLSRDGYGIRAT
jgi:hypothetical protein